MNPEHHSVNTGGGQPPGNPTESQRSQQQSHSQSPSVPPTTSATDLRVNSAVNVALSSVAKYWVFTNLFPGPIPQVSVLHGLPPGSRLENGKPIQDQLTGAQHSAGLLNGDPNLILGHHSSVQPPASLASSTAGQIPVSQIVSSQASQAHSLVGHSQHQDINQQSSSTSQQSSSTSASTQQVPSNRVDFIQHHNVDMGHHSQQHLMQQQLMPSGRAEHGNNQQIQLTVSEDGIVTVVEPNGGKLIEKEDHEIKMPADHALTVHQLQQIVGQQARDHRQVLDSVVRIEQATGEPANILVTHNPDGTTSIEASAQDPLTIKDEKMSTKMETQFAIPADIKDIKGALDLKNVGPMGMEGAVVKISAGAAEHDLHAMYKVNVEDLSQLLAYHEVFGKLNADGQTQPKSLGEVEAEAGTSAAMDTEGPPGAAGHHPCDICGKMFQFRYQLIVHRRYHGERKPFMCQSCGQAFANHVELSRHGKCHVVGSTFAPPPPVVDRNPKRIDKPYACTTCQKTFARKEHLDNHVRSHTGETPYRCQFCAKTFTRKEHMVNHVRKHTGETPHRCDICKKSFTRKEHFMNHVMWHTGETPHHCQICGKKYTRKEHLTNHMRSHTNDTPFRCELCGKSFTRKEHFTNHIMWHTGETPHRCDFCSKTFTRKEHLLNHVRQHTGESPHRCNYCNKTFTRREHLVNHVRQHTGETPFQCGYCPKAFTRKDHLVNHVRQHTGESPHKCSYCPKSFTRKEHLTNHVRQHTGESPHRCQYCSKSFTRKEHLTNHIRIHTGESPHRCEFCQKTFTRKEHLTNHLKQHTGDTPHTCKVCSKPFTRKEHLINHMSRSHTGDRPYTCGECGKSFPLKGNLLFHERSHNKGSAPRPFRCDLCPKDFICKGHLVSHRRAHTDSGEAPPAEGTPAATEAPAVEAVDPLTCTPCNKTFSDADSLQRHHRKHHERASVERTTGETVTQNTQNAAATMQNIPQVRSSSGSTGTVPAVGTVTGTFSHTTAASHHPPGPAPIQHHPVTVNY